MVHLVGAGPGDPGLVTVRARELLESCDAVVHDALVNPALLPRPGDVELYDVGKRGSGAPEAGASVRQDDINALLIRLAHEGKRVVRLKGGDPFVFGRGSEEALALVDAGIPFEVVPGITAGIAAPAYAGIPVTHRALATSVTFVTGHEDPTKPEPMVDWNALAKAGGTIVIYMSTRTLPTIADALSRAGMAGDTPAAAVEWGTHARQRTVVATLHTLAARARAEGLGAPAVTIIGPVVELRERLAWFDRRALFGRRVIVTRASMRSGALSDRLRALGADVLEMPATRIEPLDRGPVLDAIRRISGYEWIAFTSQTSVAMFWDALRAEGRDARALARAKLCAIGPATADELLAHGLVPDLLPERFVAEAVLDAMAARDDVRDTRVLYAAAEGARDVLPNGLRWLGATVDVVRLYRSVPETGEGFSSVITDALTSGTVDLVTFTSASGVRAFVDAVGTAATLAPAASIGPITSEAARAAGLDVVVEAAESTVPGLVAAIAAWSGARVGIAGEPQPEGVRGA